MNNLLKKVAVSVSTVATVASMGLMPFAAKAAPMPGEVYSTPDGTVWFITTDMQKRPFTSAGAFLSYGFLSFSQVKAADASVTALPTGSFIAPADGKIFCATETKGSDVKGECALITGGMKARFTSAAVFTGQGFSFSRAINGDSSFLSNTGNVDNASAGHLPGVLVNNSGTVQMIVSGGLWGIPSPEVFNSWGYSFSDVVPANTADKALSQVGVIPARQAGQLVPTGTTTPQPSGNFSASVSSDSPAASTLVATQAIADLAHFTVSGSGTITSIKLKRIGVSADATLSNVYLFDGNTRLTDAASVSNSYITFAGLNWSVSGSKMISVRSDILTGTSGQTVGVQLAAINGTDLSVMPSGAIHTIATATLASVAVSGASGTFTDPGTDINVFQGSVTVGTRNVTLNRVALRQIGSISSNDIKNFRLRIDGVQVASSSTLDANGYITFTPNAVMQTGTRTVQVLADVTGGSGRTVQMSLRGAYDFTATDSQYNVGVTTTGTFPFGPSASTVANGSVTVVKATDSPSLNLVACANDAILGRWTLTAYGETTKVETLKVGVDSNGTDADLTLRNGRLLVDGSQVGSTTDVAAANGAATGQSFTTNFYVTPGTPRVVEFRADMYDSEGTEEICGTQTFTSVQAALVAGSSNAVPQTSLTPINVPTAGVNANALTIALGSISLAQTNYPAQTVVAPSTNFKIGAWTLSGNSSEAVNINTLTVGFAGTDAFDPSDDLNNVYFKINGVQTSIKGTIADGSSTSLANTYTVTTNVPLNGSVTVELYADVASGATDGDGSADTMIAYLRATGITASSNTTVYADTDSDTDNTDAGSTGQTMTIGSGSITATIDSNSNPSSAIVDDSGTVTSGAWKFAAVTDSYTVTDITMTLGSSSAVTTVALKVGGTTIATKPAATSMTFSGLNIAVAANTNVVMTAELTMSPIGVGAGTTDSSLLTTLTAFTARNSSGTSAAGTESNPAGPTLYAYKAIPTVSYVALPNSDLQAGSNITIAKFSISSNGTGTIAWKQVMLEISKTATPTIASVQLVNSDTSEVITSVFTFNNETVNATPTVCGADATSCELLVTVGTNADDDVTKPAGNYEIRATIGGSIATTDNVSVKMDRNTTSHTGANVFTTVSNQGGGASNANDASFTWSDESASATGDTGVSTWNDDFLVRNTPISWNMN